MNIRELFICIQNVFINSKRNIIAVLNNATNFDKIYGILDKTIRIIFWLVMLSRKKVYFECININLREINGCLKMRRCDC